MSYLTGTESSARRRAGTWPLGLCLVAAMLWGCGRSEQKAPPGGKPSADEAGSQGAQGASSGKAALPTARTAQQVLDAMVAAYKSAQTYQDRAVLMLPEPGPEGKLQFSAYTHLVRFARPNQLGVHLYGRLLKEDEATLGHQAFSDGRDFVAFIEHLPGQVARRPAPARLSLRSVFADARFADAAFNSPTRFYCLPPVPLLLLMADDPLKTLLAKATSIDLLDAGKIGASDCYRVAVTRPDGKAVFWIDREHFLLRRLEYPIEQVKKAMIGDAKVEEFALVADYMGAELDGKMDPAGFKIVIPEGVEIVDHLALPPLRLLGKPIGDFRFQPLDGEPMERKSLEGKIAVIDFWGTNCLPCRQALPMLQGVYEKHRKNEKIAFLAVSADPAEINNDEIRKTLKDWKVDVPAARDADKHLFKTFRWIGIPATFILDAQGRVQDFDYGVDDNFGNDLEGKLRRLLEGEDLSAAALERMKRSQAAYASLIDSQASSGVYADQGFEQAIPIAQIAPRSQPGRLELKRLWKCAEVDKPGNLLVSPGENGRPRLLALDGFRAVAEIDAAGKVLATHSLPQQEDSAATLLRTAVDKSGKRCFAVSGLGQQQVHLFDADWKLLFSFPKSAESRHAGISDVQIADLGGDGRLQILVGYYGEVGVHGVSLEGTRLWTNRDLRHVTCLAVLEPDAQGRRGLLCAHGGGTLAMLDARGNKQREIRVPERMVNWVVASRSDAGAATRVCGRYLKGAAAFAVLGLDDQGREAWTYPLPEGYQPKPTMIEPIVPGTLASLGPGQWLVPGPDGSIHIVAPDGKLIDRWNHGDAIAGLATMELDGQSVLLVAAKGGVEALAVRRKDKD